MKNRESDRVSQRTSSTEPEREQHSGTGADFGQSIGRTGNLSEGEQMRNQDNERNMNKNVGMGNEQSRRPGSEGFGSSPGRGSGSLDNEPGTNISRDDESPGRSGSPGNTGSSEGRH